MYVSIAERPSTFGYNLFNDTFKKLKINAFYKPIKVNSDKLESALIALKGMNIKGCGVSMPHKINVIKYLDKIDDKIKKIGSVNTILNENNKLIGFNTDYLAVKKIFDKLKLIRPTVLVLGCGGVASSVVEALIELDYDVSVTARNFTKLEIFSNKFQIKQIVWSKRNLFKGEILINCTPIGMSPLNARMPLKSSSLLNYKIIADLVAMPFYSKLILEANKFNIYTIPGFTFALKQAVEQFKIYTGIEITDKIMLKSLSKLISSK